MMDEQQPIVLVDEENDADGFVKPAVLDGLNKRLLENLY